MTRLRSSGLRESRHGERLPHGEDVVHAEHARAARYGRKTSRDRAAETFGGRRAVDRRDERLTAWTDDHSHALVRELAEARQEFEGLTRVFCETERGVESYVGAREPRGHGAVARARR